MSTIIYGSNRKSKEKPLFTKDTPFLAKIKDRLLLSKPGSSKKTFHLSLDIKGSFISHNEGDAVGIFPKNPGLTISSLLHVLNASANTLVQDPRSTQQFFFEDYLYYKANLARVTLPLLQLLSTTSVSKKSLLADLLLAENKSLRMQYIERNDVLTCLKEFCPENLDTQAFTNTLAPLLPRFYSIASSQALYPEEIHLLVATFSYTLQGDTRTGIGSDFLCYQAESTSSIPLYIQPNPNFTLPSDPKTPIIMIGPGTGVAPYRAFLQKRSLNPTKTQNWLFFGECNQAYDFYYEKELKQLVKQDLLKITTAFSRDQSHKIYVQHQMEHHAKELWQWLDQGAILYLCGDAKCMAKDVTDTLLKIFQKEGSLSTEQSRELLHLLRKEKRFQSDVY